MSSSTKKTTQKTTQKIPMSAMPGTANLGHKPRDYKKETIEQESGKTKEELLKILRGPPLSSEWFEALEQLQDLEEKLMEKI